MIVPRVVVTGSLFAVTNFFATLMLSGVLAQKAPGQQLFTSLKYEEAEAFTSFNKPAITLQFTSLQM
jgi:hypothetical protein